MLWVVQYWDDGEWADYAVFWSKEEAREVLHWMRRLGDTARLVVMTECKEVTCG